MAFIWFTISVRSVTKLPLSRFGRLVPSFATVRDRRHDAMALLTALPVLDMGDGLSRAIGGKIFR
jgi:hypothetical protein